ncbi:MAG: tRNA lysidine(34) synthetase TilS [Flavobacteriia bacterium]
MLNKFQTYLHTFVEKHPAAQYFIAVSGGHDSMLLLEICRRNSLPITVLHVNYQLRGIESQEDQAFVETYCQLHNIPCHVHGVDLQEKLHSGGNLQQLARQERYDFFETHLNQSPNSYLFVAHHQDDQIETFWLQLFRGAGLSGLQGMLEKNGRVLRPLLPFSRKELSELSSELQLAWRNDSSNESTKYLRNLFRLKLIPELEEEIPTLRDSIQTLQIVFQATLEAEQEGINGIVKEILQNKNITLDKVLLFHEYQIVEIIKKLSIPLVLTKKITGLLSSEVGKRLSWKSNEGPFHELVRERDSLRFIPSIPQKPSTPTFQAKFITTLPTEFDKNVLFLDQSKVQGELFIRPWMEGDRMQPIGLKGSKLISDILKDDRVPSSEKSARFVLCDHEKIICCIGHRIDRRSIASNESKLIIRIEIQQ